MHRWVEHVKEVLNQRPPTHDADILVQPVTDQLPINCSQPTKAEISKAINILRNKKSPGPVNKPTEVLKADLETSTQMLHDLIERLKVKIERKDTL